MNEWEAFANNILARYPITMAALAKAEAVGGRSEPAPRLPTMCASCGKYRSDPPSRLCPGCEAYQEHQR
jgi:hypothetical protein